MSLGNCLHNIIGFAPEDCECIDNFTTDYAISDSGLYVSELQGMSLRMLDSLGGRRIIRKKMTRARENAINSFRVDLSQALMKYKEPARRAYSGDIGGRYAGTGKKVSTLVTASDYYGLRMYSDIKGGKYILRGVSLILNDAEAVDLEIYDEYDLLYTIPLGSLAHRPFRTDFTPIELTLDRNYYFLINPVGVPYANKLTCNCGGFRWCFNIDNPCYKDSREGWTEWAMIGGVYGADLNDREDWTISEKASGMILHGNFTCDPLARLCEDDVDFINNDVDRAIANAIWYKTGEFLTTYIMGSTEVSRYTLLGTEQLNENRIYYAERYNVLLDWIAASMEDNDCIVCRSPHGMRMRSQRI